MAENNFNPASGVGEVTGRAYYASVTTPNTTFDHKWEVNLVLDDETLADFENRGSYNSSVDKNGHQIGIFNNVDLKLIKNLVLSGGYRIDNNNQFNKIEKKLD